MLILNVGIGSANEHNLDLIKELFLYENVATSKKFLLVIKNSYFTGYLVSTR